ncbi:MAG: signal peptidase I [Christensenellaceae bacterium]
MENNNKESYARRSNRYHDKSNFGGSSDASYSEENTDFEDHEFYDAASSADAYAQTSDEEYDEFYDDESDSFSDEYEQIPSRKDEPLERTDDNLIDYDEFGRKRRNPIPPKKKAPPKESKSKAVWGWILSIAIAVAVALFIRAFVFEIILVDGESMQPTLYTNERVATEKVSRYFDLPERTNIIIVKYPDMAGTYVKRVIGLPGETVEVKDSTVYINGAPLTEDYINQSEPYADMAPVLVPEDCVFVMGDNRAHSMDSRTEYIGPLNKNMIVGHGLCVIWPLNNIHSINN